MAASISDALNHSNSVAQTRLRCETLIELIEEVSFPAELNPQVKAAKKRLLDNIGSEQQGSAVRAVAELVNGIRNQLDAEVRDINGYLRQVVLRLQDLQVNMLEATSIRDESVKDGGRLDQVVKEQVAGIRASVDQAEDIAELKASIDERLGNIHEHVTSFVESEKHAVKQLRGMRQIWQHSSRIWKAKPLV